MKAKVILLLHLFGLDVLLLGLVEKLLLGLSKRVAAWKDAAITSLNRCKTATDNISENCVKDKMCEFALHSEQSVTQGNPLKSD